MRILFRALLLLFAFFIALSVVKFLFFKLFFLALWVGAIAFVIYMVSCIFKKAT
jgi:hypothetical protein